MNRAALVAWLITALGGFTMLAIWLFRGGTRHQDDAGTRFPIKLILGHAGFAVAGLATWIAFVATNRGAFAWIAVALLVPIAGAGLSMLAKWLGGRASSRRASQTEQRFPMTVVAAHGVAAAVTVVLVVVAAVRAM